MQRFSKVVHSIANEDVHDNDSFNTKPLSSKTKYFKYPVYSVPEYIKGSQNCN